MHKSKRLWDGCGDNSSKEQNAFDKRTAGLSLNERVRIALANHTPRLTLKAAIRFRYVDNLQTFNAGNVFAVDYPVTDDTGLDTRYVVYSYGWHWPLYIKEGVHWYGNSDRYSITTSKHMSQFMPSEIGGRDQPLGTPVPPHNTMTCEQMLVIAEHGIAGMVLGKEYG